MTDVHDPYAALRFPDYRRLLAGGVLTSIGAGIQTVAIGWELYLRTDTAWALALVGLTQFLPVLFLAIPAGHLADRYNRKHIFQLAQMGSMTASLGLTLLSLTHGPVELVYLCLFLAGICRSLAAPARAALLPQLIPQEKLANAVTWNSTGWQFANVTGPSLGGIVLANALGIWPAYALAALCALSCALLLTPIRPLPFNRDVTPRSLGTLFAGVGFVWHNKLLLAAITLDLFAVLLGGATALLPIFAKDILEIGGVGLGWLRAAPALGALVMALVLAHLPPLRRPGVALLCAVAGFGLATIGFGLSRDFWLSFGLLALTGAFDNISVVVRGTLMQTLTPNEMRGRVAAVNTVFISSSNELGEFESGTVAALTNPVFSVVSGGLGTILVVALATLRWPEMLRLGPLHQIGKKEVIVEEALPPDV